MHINNYFKCEQIVCCNKKERKKMNQPKERDLLSEYKNKSEVSQKEKHQYSILTHIYGI